MKVVRGLLVAGLTLAACTPAQQLLSGGTTQVEIDPVTGYPALEEGVVNEGYPAPEDQIVALESGPPPAAPVDAPATEAGTASISGVLFSRTNRTVIPGTDLTIIAAGGEDGNQPPEILGPNSVPDAALTVRSDEQGWFSLTNIPPGKYYLFVWTTYDWRVAEKGENDQGQWLIELNADQRQPLGVVYVTWP
jgi:hypothetical protein